MEEGLGPETELEARFQAADGKETIDMRRDMAGVPQHMRFFEPSAPIQQNWKYPIALFLYLKDGKPPSAEEIRAYQRDLLGDVDRRDSCVIELMALPARSADEAHWRYESFVESRQQYLQKFKPARVFQMRKLIATHRPRIVIFHSLTYLADWEAVVGLSLRQITRQMYFQAVGDSAFCVIPNANSRGMSYDRLYEFAGRVRPQVSLR